MRTPELRGLPLAGSLFAVWRDRLGVVTAARELGGVASFHMGRRRLYVVNDPLHVRHVLVDNEINYRKGVGLDHARSLLGEGLLTSEGEVWRRQRKRVEPAFARARINDYTPVMRTATDELLARWERPARARTPIDLSAELRALTLEIFMRTLFETRAGESAQAVERALTLLLDEAIRRMLLPLPRSERLRTRRARRVERALALLGRQVDELLARRSAGVGGAGSDLLSALVAAREERGAGIGRAPLPASTRAQDEHGCTRLRDELLTLIVAGHETTAVALSWTLYLLGTHPRVAEDVRVDRSQLRPVVKEALRMYPPVWLIPRRTIAADQLGGHAIPAGADVLISPYALHRDPRAWDRPESFSPARFDVAGPQRIYLPFGLGPRNCVGSAFALVEIELVLSAILDRYRLRPAESRRPRPNPLLTLRPPDPFPFSVEAV